MNLTDSIAPKSDQMNADDLIAGPRTFTIVEVRPGSTEQPVEIVFAEFPSGRPYKPSKSMRRVLVMGWGSEGDAYKGRRLTLFRNPDITFGKDKVGGIQISHMSHLARPLAVALTVSKGKRAPYSVKPLADDAPTSAPVDEETVARLADLRDEWKTTEDPERKAAIEAEVRALQTAGSS